MRARSLSRDARYVLSRFACMPVRVDIAVHSSSIGGAGAAFTPRSVGSPSTTPVCHDDKRGANG